MYNDRVHGRKRGSAAEAQAPQRIEPGDYEVYWFEPPKYVDPELQEFLKNCIRETHRQLIQELEELKKSAAENEAKHLAARETFAKYLEAKLEMERLEKEVDAEKRRTEMER